MKEIKIGDTVGLSWIRGHGNAKIVGIYQDYAMVIHYCFGQRPHVVYKNDITLPERKEEVAKK